MIDAFGFLLSVVALAAVAIAIALRIMGFSWGEVSRLVGGSLVGAAAFWVLTALAIIVGSPR